MVDTDFFKETRTLGCFSYFKKLYIDTLKILNTKTWKMERRSQTIEIISKLITLAGYYGVLFLLFITLMEGTISVGAFAAVFGAGAGSAEKGIWDPGDPAVGICRAEAGNQIDRYIEGMCRPAWHRRKAGAYYQPPGEFYLLYSEPEKGNLERGGGHV